MYDARLQMLERKKKKRVKNNSSSFTGNTKKDFLEPSFSEKNSTIHTTLQNIMLFGNKFPLKVVLRLSTKYDTTVQPGCSSCTSTRVCYKNNTSHLEKIMTCLWLAFVSFVYVLASPWEESGLQVRVLRTPTPLLITYQMRVFLHLNIPFGMIREVNQCYVTEYGSSNDLYVRAELRFISLTVKTEREREHLPTNEYLRQQLPWSRASM